MQFAMAAAFVGIVAVAVVLAIVATVWFVRVRRPHQDAGIAGFRRHIDALSPESRREVMDRVRENHQRERFTSGGGIIDPGLSDHGLSDPALGKPAVDERGRD